MTNNCLTCHTDQSADWAANYVAPRPDWAKGQRAISAVPAVQPATKRTISPAGDYAFQNGAESGNDPNAIVGDFSSEDSDRSFAMQDVLYTIGSQWKQLYLSQTVEGKLFILPAQWNVADKEWVAYHPEAGEDNGWLENCGSCHVTGLNTQSWGFKEFSVGCESCHGPGAAHAKEPKKVKPFAEVDDQVCGSCHSAAFARLSLPASYRPGDKLSEHFTLATGSDVQWPMAPNSIISNTAIGIWKPCSTQVMSPATVIRCGAGLT